MYNKDRIKLVSVLSGACTVVRLMYYMFKNAYYSVLQFDIRNSLIHVQFLIFKMIVRQIPNQTSTDQSHSCNSLKLNSYSLRFKYKSNPEKTKAQAAHEQWNLDLMNLYIMKSLI